MAGFLWFCIVKKIASTLVFLLPEKDSHNKQTKKNNKLTTVNHCLVSISVKDMKNTLLANFLLWGYVCAASTFAGDTIHHSDIATPTDADSLGGK